MQNLSWLEGVCLRAVSPIGRALRKPFTFTRDGKPLTVATNGHAIVEIPGDHGFPACPENYQEAVGKGLIAPDYTASLDLEMLKAFILGAMDGACRSCDACDSEGETPVQGERPNTMGQWRTCMSCLGASAEPVRVYIGGVLFNARLFEIPLSNLSATNGLRWHNADKEKVAFLDSGEWRIGVMPMRDTMKRMVTIPSFPIAGAEKAA
jgi:hypothetical protein